MITTNTFNKERTDYQAMYNRRELDIVWTTTPIQTLRSSYAPSDQIQIVFQRSRHMIQIGQVAISFRPVINYGTNFGIYGTLAKKMMLCLTATQPSDFICFQSATIENNQICSQANISLVRPRNIIQNYINALKKPSNHKFGMEHYETGMIYSAGSGSANTGFQENSITHPNATITANLQASRFESDELPRALISRQIAFNMDFCPQISGTVNASSTYFASEVSTNADAVFGQQNSPLTLPLLPLAITCSTLCYKSQQERWQHFRQRFITAYVGPFSDPSKTAATLGQTYIVDQSADNTTLAIPQKVIYGQPVNGPCAGGNGLNTGSASTAGSVARYQGTQFTAGAYAPPEAFTNCLVTIAETAMEFNPEFGIDMVAMDSSQIIMQYQVNRIEQVLCAYLQTGLFMGSAANNPVPAGGNSSANGPTATQVQQFLNACMLPQDVSFILTDLVLRVPYLTYNDPDAYSLVRQLCYEPQSYFSIRAQQDVIPNSGQFFQRLSIGGSSLIAGIFVFIIPAQNGPKKGLVPQDTVVSYQSASPLPIGDLRSQPSWDSYYIQMSDMYVQVDNSRYLVNSIPISSPEFSTYMYLQSNLETAFGRVLDIPLEQWVKNRAVYFIPINPSGDRSKIIQDQQCIVSFSISFVDREAYSTSLGESTTSCSGQFSALTYAVTMNSLVDCKNVRTA